MTWHRRVVTMETNRTPLSLYKRQRIIEVSKRHENIKDIVQIINEEDDTRKVCRQTVSRIIKKYKNKITINDLPRSGRKSRWTLLIYDFIDKQLRLDDECTSFGKRACLYHFIAPPPQRDRCFNLTPVS